MWGDRSNEEDHHTWAHYTGCLLVEHLSGKKNKVLADLKDARWRSLSIERDKAADAEPAVSDKDGTMALWIRLHDELGPRAIGDAIRILDEENKRLRINHVRYVNFRELKKALTTVHKKTTRKKKIIDTLLP